MYCMIMLTDMTHVKKSHVRKMLTVKLKINIKKRRYKVSVGYKYDMRTVNRFQLHKHRRVKVIQRFLQKDECLDSLKQLKVNWNKLCGCLCDLISASFFSSRGSRENGLAKSFRGLCAKLGELLVHSQIIYMCNVLYLK